MPSRRFSGPLLAPIALNIEAARPRANSEPVARYGTVGDSSMETRLARALRLQTRPFSDLGLGEKQALLPLLESPFACSGETSPAGVEKKDQVCLSEKALDPIIVDKEELESLACSHELPPQWGTETIRYIWNFFSMYRLIFASIVVVNLASMGVTFPLTSITSSGAATASGINFCVAFLFRNEHVVNAVFRLACCVKPSAPLSVRKIAGKAYSYGGFHSGCAIVGMVWYFIFVTLLCLDLRTSYDIPAFCLGLVISIILFVIVFTSMPAFRAARHNTFEVVHRYGGWTLCSLLWGQLGVSINSTRITTGQPIGMLIIQTPLFWCLVIITLAILYPWTRLRLRNVRVEVLSPRAALLHFNHRRMNTCLGIRITDSPLKETHSFATISSAGDEQGFRVLMSRAGDWTSNFIKNPPTQIYVKGAPVTGVMRVALMFRKVLIVTTGTGIGPCLSLMESHPEHPMHVVWMGSDPRNSYGEAMINSVFTADRGACIVDTSKAGRGDILRLVYARYVESKAETVVIISNPSVTRLVVEGLETRGIPAFGAIFDS